MLLSPFPIMFSLGASDVFCKQPVGFAPRAAARTGGVVTASQDLVPCRAALFGSALGRGEGEQNLAAGKGDLTMQFVCSSP